MLVLAATGSAACAWGRAVERVPMDQRLAGLYGHAMDVERPQDASRNVDWENERLAVTLRVSRYLERHHELPPRIANALSQQELVGGLTKEQVQLLWGAPTRQQHLSGRRRAAQDLWYYRSLADHPWHGQAYRLAFTDGILERITAP